MTLNQLAEQYGGKAGNMKAMEAQAYLRRTTVDKLAPIFHCKPEQLYRAEGMPSPLGDTLTVVVEPSTKRRDNQMVTSTVPAVGQAMERAGATSRDTQPQRSRIASKTERLARTHAG